MITHNPEIGIECDKCPKTVSTTTLSKTRLIASARKLGWYISKARGLHYCPDCRKGWALPSRGGSFARYYTGDPEDAGRGPGNYYRNMGKYHKVGK